MGWQVHPALSEWPTISKFAASLAPAHLSTDVRVTPCQSWPSFRAYRVADCLILCRHAESINIILAGNVLDFNHPLSIIILSQSIHQQGLSDISSISLHWWLPSHIYDEYGKACKVFDAERTWEKACKMLAKMLALTQLRITLHGEATANSYREEKMLTPLLEVKAPNLFDLTVPWTSQYHQLKYNNVPFSLTRCQV